MVWSFRSVGAVETSLLILVAGLLSPRPATATPISYSFSGQVGAGGGGALTIGGRLIDLSGARFTATGLTINDVNLVQGLDAAHLGVFAATATYDFGALGSFTTAPGTDFYFQAASCWGSTCLNDLHVAFGAFEAFFINIVTGDPGITTPAGSRHSFYWPSSVTLPAHHWTTDDQSLALGNGDTRPGTSIGGITVETAPNFAPVPEPSTLVLLTSGLCAVAGRRLGPFWRRHRGRQRPIV